MNKLEQENKEAEAETETEATTIAYFRTDSNTAFLPMAENQQRKHNSNKHNTYRTIRLTRRTVTSIAFASLFVALVLVFAGFTAYVLGKGSYDAPHAITSFCRQEPQPVPTAVELSTTSCGQQLKIINGCDSEMKADEWLRIKSDKGASVLSPFYTIPMNACSAEISINVKSKSNSFDLDAVFISNNGTEFTTTLFENRSTEYCQTLPDFINAQKLSDVKSLRLMVSAENMEIVEISEQLSFRTFCPRFDNVYGKTDYDSLLRSADITYASVSAVRDNSCGMSYWKDKMTCDWLKLLTPTEAEGTGRFDRVESNNCTIHGSDDDQFLELQGVAGEDRTASLVLPMKTAADSVRVSFWSLIKCQGPRLDLFVVRNLDELDQGTPDVRAKRERVEEIVQERSWHFHTFDIDLSDEPTKVQDEMQTYFIVIEGFVPAWPNCIDRDCGSLVAVDEVHVQELFPSCKVSDSSFLDCSFEPNSTCLWGPVNENAISDFTPIFHESVSWVPWAVYPAHIEWSMVDWLITNISDHSEGQGHYLHFNPNTGHVGFISPIITSNSDCVCAMKMKYRAILEAQTSYKAIMQVDVDMLIHSGNGSFTRLSLWSSQPYQVNQWMNATISINTMKETQFQIEIKKDEESEDKYVFIDDILFEDCDFSLVQQEGAKS